MLGLPSWEEHSNISESTYEALKDLAAYPKRALTISIIISKSIATTGTKLPSQALKDKHNNHETLIIVPDPVPI